MTERPEDLADPPAIEDGALGLGLYGEGRDLLSDLLGSVRLRGERMVAYAPTSSFSMGFTAIGALHVIEQGEMQLEVDADQHVERVRGGTSSSFRAATRTTSAANELTRSVTVRTIPSAPVRPRAGCAERSRSAIRRRVTCSPASLPRSSCEGPATRRSSGSR